MLKLCGDSINKLVAITFKDCKGYFQTSGKKENVAPIHKKW